MRLTAIALLGEMPSGVRRLELVGDGPWIVRLWVGGELRRVHVGLDVEGRAMREVADLVIGRAQELGAGSR